MSKISLTGNASGTGTITLASPNTSTDRTIDLPDAAGTVFVSGQALSATTGSFSGNVTLGSSVLATPTGSAPAYLCRAFVNFDGTGTVAIRASGNVSSITDVGTGDYTVNLTTAMPDANYSTVKTVQLSGNVLIIRGSNFDTTSFNAYVTNTVNVTVDASEVFCAVFR